MHTQARPSRAFAAFTAVVAAAGAGCITIEEFEYNHENPVHEEYNGPVDQSTTVDDVVADDVDVDIDADADVDARADVDVDNDVSTQVCAVGATVFVAPECDFAEQGDGAGDEDGAAGDGDGGGDGGGTDEPTPPTPGEPVTVQGERGLALVYTYHGPLFEHVTLEPRFEGAAAASVAHVEIALADVELRSPGFLEDDAEFDWGEADFADAADGVFEFIVAEQLAPDALLDATWDRASERCAGGACHSRSIAAVCSATLLLRATLEDGSVAAASLAHRSPRPECDQ